MTVLIASNAKKAYADHGPLVNINLNFHNGVTQQGQSLAQYTFWHFQRITCDMNVGGPHSTSFDDPCYYRRYVYERDTTNDISRCWSGGRRSFSQGTGVSSVIGYSQNVIPTNCPVGLYTLKGILAGSDKVAVTIRTAEFQVIARPPPSTSTPIPRLSSGGDGTTGGGTTGGGDGGTPGGTSPFGNSPQLQTSQQTTDPYAVIHPGQMNERAGPGTQYEILTTLPQGTWAQIMGIDAQGEWYRVNLPDLDQPAWLSRAYIKVAGGSLSNLVRIAMGEGPSTGLLGWITVA